MKKSLLAIAIAAAVPAVASAQVTVGGIMDGGFNSVTTKQGTETTVNQTGGNAAGALASNRLFFRGTEKNWRYDCRFPLRAWHGRWGHG